MLHDRQLEKQQALEEHFVAQARTLRKEAKRMPRGPRRDALMRRARLDEAASLTSAWLNSPLKAPT